MTQRILKKIGDEYRVWIPIGIQDYEGREIYVGDVVEWSGGDKTIMLILDGKLIGPSTAMLLHGKSQTGKVAQSPGLLCKMEEDK